MYIFYYESKDYFDFLDYLHHFTGIIYARQGKVLINRAAKYYY